MVFPVLQITSDPIQGYPLYSLLTIFLACVYLLSGYGYLRLTTAITIITASVIPFVTLMLFPVWSRAALSMQILSWPVLASLIGSQLLSIRKQVPLIGGTTVGLLILTFIHPGVELVDAVEVIAVFFTISILLMFTSWTQAYYSKGLEESNRNLAARRRELEIYTSLLRHDLGNDIQMILGGIELSQISAGEYKQKAYLESTLASAERMRSLLHMFSVTEAELDADILTVLEKIGQRAEIAFKGMLVSIDATDEIRTQPPKYSRLVALAFENLLRNSAQHAGNVPNVEIKLSRSGDSLEIMFGDDGPGIKPEIRNSLFERGTTTGEQGKGLGLYLTKAIIESEKGTIELLTQENPGCCFYIKLPLYNSL